MLSGIDAGFAATRPFEPGVCAPGRHPLEYQVRAGDACCAADAMSGADLALAAANQVSDERLRYWSMNWLRQDFDKAMANFTVPEEEQKRQEAVEKEWGFCPEPGQVIDGFNSWNTTMPPPPSPGSLSGQCSGHRMPALTERAVLSRRDQNRGSRGPRTVQHHPSGGARVRGWRESVGARGEQPHVAGPGNAQALREDGGPLRQDDDGDGPARSRAGSTPSAAGATRCDMSGPDRGPAARQELLFGALAVPSVDSAQPVLDVLGSESKPPGLDSFCLHLAATPPGSIGGRWLLQPWSLGSFTGAECAFQVNMSKPELGVQPLLSTIEVRGGPWLLQQCGLRSCGAVAVDCTRRSLVSAASGRCVQHALLGTDARGRGDQVKLRQCAIGGISHNREEHSAGGRAVMGVFCRDFCRCVMLYCTVEQTGWFYMPAVRCAGVAQVLVTLPAAVGCLELTHWGLLAGGFAEL